MAWLLLHRAKKHDERYKMKTRNQEVAKKLQAGMVHNYGNLFVGIATSSKSLTEDIKSNLIHSPDLSPEQLDILKKYAESAESVERFNYDLRMNQVLRTPCAGYAFLYSFLEFGKSLGISMKHPLIDYYLKTARIPIHLQREMTVLRADIDAIRKLYALDKYWQSIPRDEDTQPFYNAAFLFHKGVSSPFIFLEQELETKGLFSSNQANVTNSLEGITRTCEEIMRVGDIIAHRTGPFFIRPWNIGDVDPTISALLPSSEIYAQRQKISQNILG